MRIPNSRRFLSLAVALLTILSAASLAAQVQERYRVRLTTVPMDGGMRNTVAGSGAASATLAGTKLSITGTFDGLKSPATAARLHSGVARGVRGNPVGDLTVARTTKGNISGTFDLTADQLKGLRDGRLYIEISSEKAPEGNLWGWLLK